MKKVRGTIVRHMVVEETQYQVNAYCDECLQETVIAERPERPTIGDEFQIVEPGRTASDKTRSLLPGIVRDGVHNRDIIGYRCSGCDRRLDLDAK